MPRTATGAASSPGSEMPSRPDPGAAIVGAAVASTPEDWWQVSLRVPADLVEPTAALFETIAPTGVAVEWPFEQGEEFGAAVRDAAAEARVSCYLPADSARELLADLRGRLRALGHSAAARRLETVRRRRADWETAFQRFLRPIRAGRLLVRPWPCAEVPREGEIVVDLEPGLAFGTGQHPTTRMALAALADWIRPGDAVLDFGAGSGLLSCAAARLGAARVLAVDLDPQALEATRRNARRNGAVAVIEARRAEAPPGDGPPYDVVVANISAGVIVQALSALARATRPGGRCLLGGVIATQLPRVRQAVGLLPAGNLDLEEVDGDGEWRSLRCARPAPVH